MFRRWTKRGSGFFCFILLRVFLLFSSCGFMDLRPIGISTSPGIMDELLPGAYSPVLIEFDTEMLENEVKQAVQINAESGPPEGDFSWEGNRLLFIPLEGWKPGIRYTLSLSGTLYSRDGRELRLDRQIPFYALFRSLPPVLESFSPADGASVEVRTGENSITEFHFSRPMDRLSVEMAFTLDGLGELSFHWTDEDRCLKVFSARPLNPWTVYRWNIGTKAQSREGTPLAKSYSARFCTDKDRIFPFPQKVFPMIRSGARWFPAAADLEAGLGPGQAIGIEFNKALGDNVSQSIRLDPSLPGRIEALSETAFVFIPDHDPGPETMYTLIISGDLRDAGGLKMGAGYTRNFWADIPYLRIIALNVEGLPPLEPEDGPEEGRIGGPLRTPVDMTGGGVLRYTIRFSLPFTETAKQETAFRITLSPFFPGTLEPIALRSLTWLSADLLRMEWEGLQPGVEGEAHYYKLNLPGGKGGIGNGGGMYLREDNFLYLEAIP